MSDSAFDALRDAGEYPPKGWNLLPAPVRRDRLMVYFSTPSSDIQTWMRDQAEQLGIGMHIPTAK